MIPIYQPCFDGNEKEYVLSCLESSWISSKGAFIPRFEHAFAEYIGAEYTTTVANGTVALHLALDALGIGTGDEVIVPTLTYVASVNTILQTGARPMFVDSLLSTWNVDVEAIRRRITPRTKAVMIVHLYGLPCDMTAIVELCRAYQLYLIEDCAEAFGSYYQNQHVGTFSDVATFSFFGNKTITTGEGGMVVCRDDTVHQKVCHLKNQGVSKSREYWHDVLAYNYRMTNICAAIGLAQLEYADQILQRKRTIAQRYAKQLKHLPLVMQMEKEGERSSYWMVSIVLNEAEHRQPLRAFLKAAGIETRPLFPPVHTMPHCFEETRFPHAESLSARGMNLPSYPALTDAQVDEICEVIFAYYQKVDVVHFENANKV